MQRIIILFIIFIIGCYMICHSITHMEKRKSIYIFLLIIGILIASLSIPFLINELYQYGITSERKYYTLWEAKDVLSFYGSFLSFIGTVALGALALWQNKKFKEENDIAQKRIESVNDKLLELDKLREKEKLLEKYFSYVDEAEKLLNYMIIIGIPKEGRSSTEIMRAFTECCSKVKEKKRRIEYLDKKNASHDFYNYVNIIIQEIAQIILDYSDNKISLRSNLGKYMNSRKDEFDRRAKQFILDIDNTIEN